MAKPALSSAVGDIMQQRWIDLDAAYQLLCRLSLNDTNDSHIYVSLAGLQHLFFESMRSGGSLDWQPSVIASRSISTTTVSTIPAD